MPGDPLRDLKAAARVHRRARERVDETAERLNTEVRRAVEMGFSLRVVGEAVGISRQRVHQIIQRSR